MISVTLRQLGVVTFGKGLRSLSDSKVKTTKQFLSLRVEAIEVLGIRRSPVLTEGLEHRRFLKRQDPAT